MNPLSPLTYYRRHKGGALLLMTVFRTVRETGSAVGLAWLLGAAVCIAGLLAVQNTVYAPRGLSLNLANPTPWLFTLPIPLAIVVVSTGTISHMLRKFDPVATIERRA